MADDMAKFTAKMTKKDRIVALKEQGYSNRQIADAVGCIDSYVRAVLQRQKHPERDAAYKAKYYAADPDKYRARYRERYRKNPERARERCKQYYKENRERVLAYQQKRREARRRTERLSQEASA